MTDERLHFCDPVAGYNAMGAAEHVVRYQSARQICRDKRVLDVGCGEGYGSSLLARWGAAEVLGVDISGEAIGTAKRLFASDNVSFVVGDATRLSDVLGAVPAFDLIVSFETLEHVSDVEALLSGILLYRAEGGTIIISCPNDHVEDTANPFHRRTFTFEEFREVATRQLGAASRWLVGTPAQGYLVYEPGDPRVENNESGEALLLTRYEPLDVAALLPAQSNVSPGPKTCRFYIGAWGENPGPGVTLSAQSFPAFIEAWRANEYLKLQTDRLATALAEAEDVTIRHLESQVAHFREHLDAVQARSRVSEQKGRQRLLFYTEQADALAAQLAEQKRETDSLLEIKAKWWDPELKRRGSRLVELEEELAELNRLRNAWWEPELDRRGLRIAELEEEVAEFKRLKDTWWDPELGRRASRLLELEDELAEFKRLKTEWWDPELSRRGSRIAELEEDLAGLARRDSRIAELQQQAVDHEHHLARSRQAEAELERKLLLASTIAANALAESVKLSRLERTRARAANAGGVLSPLIRRRSEVPEETAGMAGYPAGENDVPLLLRCSGLFAPAWYLGRYPDVADSGRDPLEHFLLHGLAEGRWPGPLFDPERYRQDHPEAATTGLPALVHYLAYGLRMDASAHSAEQA